MRNGDVDNGEVEYVRREKKASMAPKHEGRHVGPSKELIGAE